MLDSILKQLVELPPIAYFGLLMCAGLGIPVSEDALAIWAGGLIGRGDHANIAPAHWYVVALYFGAILSDLLTFSLGRLTHNKLGTRLQSLFFRDPEVVENALAKVRRYGNRAGFVQRMSIGARWPIAFFSGYSGISPLKFFLGAALGACISLPIQLGIGYAFRNQIQQVLDFIQEYGSFFAIGIFGFLGLFLYRKLRGNDAGNSEADAEAVAAAMDAARSEDMPVVADGRETDGH